MKDPNCKPFCLEDRCVHDCSKAYALDEKNRTCVRIGTNTDCSALGDKCQGGKVCSEKKDGKFACDLDYVELGVDPETKSCLLLSYDCNGDVEKWAKGEGDLVDGCESERSCLCKPGELKWESPFKDNRFENMSPDQIRAKLIELQFSDNLCGPKVSVCNDKGNEFLPCAENYDNPEGEVACSVEYKGKTEKINRRDKTSYRVHTADEEGNPIITTQQNTKAKYFAGYDAQGKPQYKELEVGAGVDLSKQDFDCDGFPDGPISLCETLVEAGSYIGCEYWSVYMHNGGQAINMAVVLSNGNPGTTANVRIYRKHNGKVELYKTTKIAPRSVSAVELAKGIDYMIWGTTVQPYAFRILSDVPITAYQFNPMDHATAHTNDASLLLPKNALGKEHLVMSWKTFKINDLNILGSYAVVVATEDNTQVEVTSSTTSLPGKHYLTGDLEFKMGQPKRLTMNRYEALSILLHSNDITGSSVISNKKVAVFGGTPCSFVPLGFYACDHLEEQMLPLHSWGKKYHALRTKPRKNETEIWRIMAQHNNTQVKIIGNTPQHFTLSATEFKEIQTGEVFEIEADNPVMVSHFTEGVTRTGASEGDKEHIGDPSQITAIPYEQYRKNYIFIVPDTYDINFVTVVAPVGAQVRLDGKIIPQEEFTAFGKRNFAYTYKEVMPGAHELDADKPVGAYGYGYFSATSYGYPLGLDLKVINQADNILIN